MLKKILRPEAFLILLILLEIVLQFILAANNNFSHDDYLFLNLYRQYGFKDSVIYWYYSWQGRVGAYMFINLFLLLNNYVNTFILYHIFYLTVFVTGFYLLIKNLHKRLELNIENARLWFMSFFFYVLFHIITYDKTTVFWLNASIIYHLCIALAIGAAGLIFSKKNNGLTIGLILVLSLFAGCSVEHFSMVYLAILFLLLLCSFIFADAPVMQETKVKIAVAILGCVAGITIMVLCPGLAIRRASFPKPDLVVAVKVALNSSYHYYKFFFLPELGKLIFMAAPFLYLGIKYREIKYVQFIQKPIYIIGSVIIIFFGLTVFSFFVMAYGTGGMGQLRTLTHVAFLLAFGFCLVFFITGYFGYVNRQVSVLMMVTGIFIFFTNLSVDYLKKLPESICYATSLTNRMEIVKQAKQVNRQDILVVDTLCYDPEIFYWSDELSVDTAGEWNKALKQAKQLPFDLRTEYPTHVDREKE